MIAQDPAVLDGKPHVHGTCVSVEHVLELLAAGMGEDVICRSYPRLTFDDVRECVVHALEAVRRERAHATPE